MALTTAGNANAGVSGLSSLYTELINLQDAILKGQRPQYRLPASALAKLQSSVSDLQTYKRRVPQDGTQRKRQRLEDAIQEQGERRKDERAIVDVDSILRQAQQLIQPVSGLKSKEDDKSSFDENDYYSSQVESKWSEDEVKAFTADFESLQPVSKKRNATAMDSSEDEYIPDEPLAQKAGVSPDDEPSDYEPGEVSQSDEYSPAHAPMSDNEPRLKVKNHLTQIAAPQPNRISPMAMHKTYELELVNGRPEMVRKKYDTDARQSSASPPVRQGRRKAKKRRKEEQTPQLRQPKKRLHKDTTTLDDSAQYTNHKEEPKPTPRMPRAVSAVQPPARREEDLRRVATLHAQQWPEYTPYSPAAYAQPPPVYRQPTVAPPAMPPPRPFIAADGGVRYYPVEAAPPLPYDRAPSRVSQYDPNNARIDYTQSVRPTPATPAYQDARIQIRPEYEPAPAYARPFAAPEFPPYRQETAAPQYYRQPEPRPVYDPHAYGAVREGMSVLYPPQGPPPPLPYAIPPEQHVRYVDPRGYELPPHMRPAADARPY